MRDGGIAADLVTDEDRTVERHPGDGDGGDAALRALRGDAAAGEIHLGEQPAAEDVAVGVGVAGHRNGAQGRLGRPRMGGGLLTGHGQNQPYVGGIFALSYCMQLALILCGFL